jgi:hypothetical protein
MIGIDCTRSCKSSYLAITTTTLLPVNGIPSPLLILNGSSMWCRYKQYKNTTCTDSLPPRYRSSVYHYVKLSGVTFLVDFFLFWKQWKCYPMFIFLKESYHIYEEKSEIYLMWLKCWIQINIGNNKKNLTTCTRYMYM